MKKLKPRIALFGVVSLGGQGVPAIADLFERLSFAFVGVLAFVGVAFVGVLHHSR